MKTYENKINNLNPNQIYCFGSNPVGINGSLRTGKGGAALFALKKGWVSQGEKMDNCLSKSGKAWGIVTGKKLYDYANDNKNLEFLIAYTRISNYNLNGYTNKQLADMFSKFDIPDNIIFEKEFSTLITKK